MEFQEVHTYKKVYLDLINVQRKELNKIRKENIFELEVIQKQQMELDFDESKLSQNAH
jgi:hypothetical protein